MFSFQTRTKKEDNFTLRDSDKIRPQDMSHSLRQTHSYSIMFCMFSIFSSHPNKQTSCVTRPLKLQSQGFRSQKIKIRVVCSILMCFFYAYDQDSNFKCKNIYAVFYRTSTSFMMDRFYTLLTLFLKPYFFSFTVSYETLHFILNSYNSNVSHKNIPYQ